MTKYVCILSPAQNAYQKLIFSKGIVPSWIEDCYCPKLDNLVCYRTHPIYLQKKKNPNAKNDFPIKIKFSC